MTADVSRETEEKLYAYVELLLTENKAQNLIAKSTENEIWSRHIDDALQLLAFGETGARWVDIGSGPGLPGIVIAIATGDPVTLIEPRPRRTAFLTKVSAALGLDKLTVITGKAENAMGRFDVITARAVAKAPELLTMTVHLAHADTRWILPKGRTAQLELEALRSTWQGDFRVEPSRTNLEAGILIADNVRRRGRR